MTDEIELTVKLTVPETRARNALLEDDLTEVWDAERDQLSVYRVNHAATSVGGGIHLHRPEGLDDLFYPPTEEHGLEIDDPIKIISARPPAEDEP